MESLLVLLVIVIVFLPIIALVMAGVALSRANRALDEAARLSQREFSIEAARSRASQTAPSEAPPQVVRPQEAAAPRPPLTVPTPTPAARPAPPTAPVVPTPPPTVQPPPAHIHRPTPRPAPPNPPPVLPAAATSKIEAEEREANLGSRWATRTGLGFALLGIIFLGVYVARETPTWLRWVSLLATSFATLGAGHLMEARRPRFGRSLFAGGLAAIYLTAFAAFALPYFRLTSDPLTGWALQLGAAGFALLAANLKRRPEVAYLTAALGTIAGIAAPFLGLQAYTLPYLLGWQALLLALALRRRWDRLALVALGSTLAQAGVLLGQALLDPAVDLPLPRLLGMSIGLFGLQLVACWGFVTRWTRPAERLRSLQVATSAALVFLGLGIHQLHPAFFDGFLGFAALALAGMATIAWSRREAAVLVDTWWIKAFAFGALYWISHYDGYLPALALSLQSFGLLALWWRHQRTSLLLAWMISWTGALSLLAYALIASAAPAAWPLLAATVVLLLGIEAFQSIAQRRGEADPAPLSAAGLPTVQTVAIGLVGWLLSATLSPDALQVAHLALAAVATAAWSALWKRPRLVLLPLFCYAQAGLLWWITPASSGWLNVHVIGTLLALVPLLAAILLPRLASLRENVRAARAVEAIGLLGFLAVAHRWSFAFLPSPFVYLVPLGLLFTLGWFGAGRLRTLAGVAPAAMLGVIGLALHAVLRPAVLVSELPGWAVATSFAWLVPFFLAQRLRRERPTLAAATPVRSLEGIWTALILAFVGVTMLEQTSPAYRTLSVIASSLVAIGLASPRLALRLPHLIPALVAGATGLALQELSWLHHGGVLPWIALTLTIGLLLTLSLVRRLRENWHEVLFVLAAGLLAVALPLCAGPAWESWTTGFWAASGLALFGLGWGLRQAPHRWMGLAIIGLSIVRAFLIDLDNTFARIVAFLGLGLVLVAIGFLYSRLEHPRASADNDQK